jgi:hypothetical protein
MKKAALVHESSSEQGNRNSGYIANRLGNFPVSSGYGPIRSRLISAQLT